MVLMADRAETLEDAERQVRGAMASGAGLDRFRGWSPARAGTRGS